MKLRKTMRGFRRAALCAALCLSVLVGCGGKPEEEAASISVYYINKEETRITAVEKPLEGDTLEQQTQNVLEMLAENPVELSLRTTVNGFSIKSWEVKDAQLVLDMSTEYKKLSATAEVLIRAAIVRTMTQLEGIENVSFTVGGEALTDSLGSIVGPMTADMFIDNAGKEINAYEKTRLKLYFADGTGERLVEVISQPIVYSSNISMEKLVLEQLIAGPSAEDGEAYAVLSSATKVLGVTVKDGVCYVNFDENALMPVGNATAQVQIYAIVNSLAELPNINRVQIAVGGKTDVLFGEKIQLSTVFDRNLDLVYGTEEK
ncbi:MAG: GerMN domain-containing protein [Firmicutes bacterium]|nr:GerMN domain-containing protein [Bacillota bacterium]